MKHWSLLNTEPSCRAPLAPIPLVDTVHESEDAALRASFQALFAKYDRNGEGLIAIQNVGLLAQDLGEVLTDAELDDLRKALDPLASGSVSLHDFFTFWTG